MLHSGFSSRRQQAFRLAEVDRERLFGEHVFAGVDRAHQWTKVLGIHQAVVHHVDVGCVDQLLEPSTGTLHAVLLGDGPHLLRVPPIHRWLDGHAPSVNLQPAVA